MSATWAVPSTAVSGVYIAHLIAGSAENHISLVVRDDAGTHDIVFQTSDTTWHAYNGWHGNSLYGGGGSASDGRAFKVSYNRPIATRDGTGAYAGPKDFLLGEKSPPSIGLRPTATTCAIWPGSRRSAGCERGTASQLISRKDFYLFAAMTVLER